VKEKVYINSSNVEVSTFKLFIRKLVCDPTNSNGYIRDILRIY